MSDRLTTKPRSVEFLVELYEIACQSTHPIDKALVPVLSRKIRNRKRLMIQALESAVCTHNYGFFDWKPCRAPAVALVSWDNEITRLGGAYKWIAGKQVCRKHLLGVVKEATAMGAEIVGRRGLQMGEGEEV